MADPPKRILDHEKYLKEVEYRIRIADIAGRIVALLALAVILVPVYMSIDAIAGETTEFNVKLGLSVGIIVGGSAFGAFVMWLKGSSQRKEIRRLRQRVSDLERRLGLTQGDRDD